MNKIRLKKSFFSCAIPALFVAACNSGSSTSSSTPYTCGESCIIFVTNGTYNGDLQHGGGSPESSSMSGIPAANGFAGGDAICQYEAQESGLPGTYKALLLNNNATKPGVAYYTLNNSQPGTTLVKIATSTNLGLWGESLITSIHTPSGESRPSTNLVLTGFTPDMNESYTGWNSYPEGESQNSCNNWTSPSINDQSIIGDVLFANSVSFPPTYDWNLNSPQANNNWGVVGSAHCNSSERLYCVQQ